jgi:hypothetical protein
MIGGWINMAGAFDRLKQTDFRYRQEILDAMLTKAAAAVQHKSRVGTNAFPNGNGLR